MVIWIPLYIIFGMFVVRIIEYVNQKDMHFSEFVISSLLWPLFAVILIIGIFKGRKGWND